MREVDDLSLEQRCGQLLVVGFSGTTPTAFVRQRLQQKALGGVIAFSRNLTDAVSTWTLCRELTNLAPAQFPPFVAIDQEGGRVRRLRDRVLELPPFGVWAPPAPASLRRKVVLQQATELAALGFNLNFAPVADVHSNAENPIIGDRAASSDPREVTQICATWIEAQQAAGVMACLKHFPGHGDTSLDSHFELPTVDKSTVELRTTELYPFERLCRQAAAVMTAHVLYPMLDTDPATFSARLCTTLLRREFGFEGVLFSDDLEMGALSRHWPIEESAVRAVRAGCDALLICSSEELQERASRALVAEAERDAAFRDRIQEAVERSLVLRRRFAPKPATDRDALSAVLESHAHRDVQRRLNALAKNQG